MTNAKRQAGLSLVEMLVVVAIVAVVASLAVTLALRISKQAKERDLASAFALFKSALQEYRDQTGEFPAQPELDFANATVHMQWLYEQLMAEPASRKVLSHLARFPAKEDGPDLEAAPIRDPWGTVLDYRFGPDDDFPEFISAGPDKVFGTEDDISSMTG